MAFTTVNAAAKQIFKNFLIRDGWTAADAENELTFLLASDNISVIKSYYIAVPRIGAKALGGRNGRIVVWNTWENAINHSTFGA